jgi:hypothetical protein
MTRLLCFLSLAKSYVLFVKSQERYFFSTYKVIRIAFQGVTEIFLKVAMHLKISLIGTRYLPVFLFQMS